MFIISWFTKKDVTLTSEKLNSHLLFSHIIDLPYAPVQRIYMSKIIADLIELDLSDMGIQTLEPGVFQQLKNLENLMLDYNELEHIDTNCFKGLKNLERLNLRNNKLKCLKSEMFENDKLEVFMDTDAFAGLQNIEMLELRGKYLVIISCEQLLILIK